MTINPTSLALAALIFLARTSLPAADSTKSKTPQNASGVMTEMRVRQLNKSLQLTDEQQQVVILRFFEGSMVEAELVIPYARQGGLGEVYENTTVLAEHYDEHGRRLRVRGLPAAIAKLTSSFG